MIRDFAVLEYSMSIVADLRDFKCKKSEKTEERRKYDKYKICRPFALYEYLLYICYLAFKIQIAKTRESVTLSYLPVLFFCIVICSLLCIFTFCIFAIAAKKAEARHGVNQLPYISATISI